MSVEDSWRYLRNPSKALLDKGNNSPRKATRLLEDETSHLAPHQQHAPTWAHVVFSPLAYEIKPSDKSSFKGCPSVSFSKEEVEALSNRFRFALIGRFRRRPPIAVVKNFLTRLGLAGGFTIGELNSNSILINFEQDEDYQRLFLRKSWTLGKEIMVVTKWSPNLRPNEDSPIVPVWVSIPNLPIHLHDQKALFCITSKLGKPLKVDNATLNFSRPKAARVCIEIDVSKYLHQKIHVKHIDEDLFFQVLYEDPPSFCDSCHRLGHNATTFKAANQPEILVGNLPLVGTMQPRKDKGKVLENEWTTVQRKTRRQHNSNMELVPKPTFTLDPPQGKEQVDLCQAETSKAGALRKPQVQFIKSHEVIYLDTNGLAYSCSEPTTSDGGATIIGDLIHATDQCVEPILQHASSDISLGLHTDIPVKMRSSSAPSSPTATSSHLASRMRTRSDFKKSGGSRLPDLEAITDFSNCIRDNNLLECNYTGSSYTWHGVRSNGNVWRRLDRVFYNTFWADHWNIISMQHLAKGGSDHCPILFLSKPGARNTTKSFRFQNMWLLRGDFMQYCKESWEEIPFHGGMQSLFKRLHHLKEKLSSWNKTHFGNIFNMIKEAEDEATKAEQLFEENPSTDNKILYNQKVAELQEVNKREHAFWKQKCNLKWLRDGDANTKFFHNLVKEKRRKQQITGLFNEQGQLVDKPDDMEALAINHFTTLFNSSERCSSKDEIKLTVWNMEPNSSPGPDGFNINFFKHCWDIIKGDITSACQEVFLGIPLPKAASSSNICLLPKGAYVPRREIMDQILINMIKEAEDEATKAEQLFEENPSTDNKILYNQKVAELQEVNKREHAFWKQKCNLKWFNSGRKSIPITHLSYADDIIIFSSGNTRSVANLKSFLNEYQLVSGQTINYSKSSFMMGSKPNSLAISKLERLLGISHKTYPFTYLGIPIDLGITRQIHCANLISSFDTKLNGWYQKNLDQAGRLVLINHVLNTLPNYFLASNTMPKSIKRLLDQKMARFWWGGKHHWISWQKLCAPKEEGGLGTTDFKSLENAFSLKLWWKYHNDNGLWARLMKAKYWRNGEMKANITDSLVWKRIFNIEDTAIDAYSVSDDGMMHWKLDPNGSFTLRSAYELCRDASTPMASFNYLWESPQNPKISIFTWKLFRHCIPTPENLQKLGFLMPSMCPFCKGDSYDAKHSLIDCHMIRGIWHHFSACVGILHHNSPTINQHFLNWWLRGNNTIYGYLRMHMPGIISWHIWKALNSLIYEDNSSFNPSKLIDSISSPKIRVVKWLAPPKGRIKLNVDASFSHNAKHGAAILRDDQGRFVGAASFQVTELFSHSTSIPLGKVEGFYKGIPSASFTYEEEGILAENFKFAVIGRSSQELNLQGLKAFLLKGGFNGGFKIRRVSAKTILFIFTQEADYVRFLRKQNLFVGSAHLHVCKWSKNLNMSFDNPVVPIWVTFKNLPLHFMSFQSLFTLASTIGRPIQLDEKTANLDRGAEARVLIERDLSLPFPNSVHLRIGDKDLIIPCQRESYPDYCTFCKKLGHNCKGCKNLTGKANPGKGKKVEQKEDGAYQWNIVKGKKTSTTSKISSTHLQNKKRWVRKEGTIAQTSSHNTFNLLDQPMEPISATTIPTPAEIIEDLQITNSYSTKDLFPSLSEAKAYAKRRIAPRSPRNSFRHIPSSLDYCLHTSPDIGLGILLDSLENHKISGEA
ncbi:unnamed protein product [Cuscuta campestris]|uniref:DUF4283 domain-containing protein n=1 Tax=Cuscuta campestris TaxID=132261 RepID=A0A484NCC7_9ASTE|nr:unnamed protein product [Cuscuta campestris]